MKLKNWQEINKKANNQHLFLQHSELESVSPYTVAAHPFTILIKSAHFSKRKKKSIRMLYFQFDFHETIVRFVMNAIIAPRSVEPVSDNNPHRLIVSMKNQQCHKLG